MTSNKTLRVIAILLLLASVFLPPAQPGTARFRMMTIAPVSAPPLVLELTPGSIKDRFTLYTAVPTNTVNQKWLFLEDEADMHIVQSAWDKELVRSVSDSKIQ